MFDFDMGTLPTRVAAPLPLPFDLVDVLPRLLSGADWQDRRTCARPKVPGTLQIRGESPPERMHDDTGCSEAHPDPRQLSYLKADSRRARW